MTKAINWTLNIGQRLDGIEWKGSGMHVNMYSDIEYRVSGENDVKRFRLGDYVHKFQTKLTGQYINDYNCCGMIDTFENENIRVTRKILYDNENPDFIHIQLKISNIADVPVSIERFVLFGIKGKEDLKIGDCQDEWSFLRQGRYKNDMPSCFIFGRNDGAYKDAHRGLSESGIRRKEDDTGEILSCELSVISAVNSEKPSSLLIGFLTESSQLVCTKVDTEIGTGKFKSIESYCTGDGVILNKGEEIVSEWLRLDANPCPFFAIQQFTLLKNRANAIVPKTDKLRAPSVYCTWYYYGPTITQEDILENISALSKKKIPTDVFQIDDGWSPNYGDWEANEKFPAGMKFIAEEIDKAGFTPGIWTSPFIVSVNSRIAQKNPHWILKKRNGELIYFNMVGVDYLVLDISHPEVLTWLEELYQRLTKKWGYLYHKLDFTRAAVLSTEADYYDKKRTRAEIFRKGVEAVRRGAGSQAFICLCGGLYGTVIGLVDAQRSGSDVISKWSRLENPDPDSGPDTIKQNVLRYYMNSFWFNDADALMLRRNEKSFRDLELSVGMLTDDEAIIFVLNNYFSGGIVSFTERVNEVQNDRLGLLRHVIPSIGKSAIARDMFLGKRMPEIFDTKVDSLEESHGKWHTVAFINWTDEQKRFCVKFDENMTGMFSKEFESYTMTEFWSGTIIENLKYGDPIDTGIIKSHSSKLFKVTPEYKDKPTLVYSNGHFSMGGTEVTKWIPDSKGVDFHIDWQWEFPLHLIIRAPWGFAWQKGENFTIDTAHKNIINILLPGRFSGSFRLNYMV